MTLDGEEVEGNAAIAEAFARYFKSVYEDSYLDCDQLTAAALGSPVTGYAGIACLTFTNITEGEILQAIKNLKSRRSFHLVLMAFLLLFLKDVVSF
ncbi:hypothetical protein J6590_098114 [Homalodisca vitripennis]|nr:hypothetical protein J6590_098114 [Homalodisca vitripennis]